MAPINKKFRAVDALNALKYTSSSSCSSLSPPSSPSISSPSSVIVRNDFQRVDANGHYFSDSEQIDSSRIKLPQRDIRNEIISGAGSVSGNVSQQDSPIDATIGATFGTKNVVPSDSASNDDSNDNLPQTNTDEREINNSHALRFASSSHVASFSPISPPSLQHHSQDQNSNRRRAHLLHSQQTRLNSHSENYSLHQHHHEMRQNSQSPHNPEAPLLHHLHNHLQIHPQQHLNIQHHPSSNINSHCIIPSPSSSPFEATSSRQHSYSTFPFSPASSAHSHPPSPSSVIQENIGHKESTSSSGPSAYTDSVYGVRIRADNSNSEPFPPDKNSKNIYSKRSNKSSPLSIETGSHRHVSFRVDAPSPTPSKSSTASESHKSSGKGNVDKNSEEYRLRRERNNIAVRKSRSKSKVKFIQTIDRMNQLEEENNKLHARIDEMSREVTVLRLLVAKYHREDPRRLEHLEHLLAIEMSQEISMLDVGNNRLQVRNYEDSRSNINPFYKER